MFGPLGAVLTGLDLAGRAELLGVSCAEYVRQASTDPRRFDEATLWGAGLDHFREWHTAGCPAVDLEMLEYVGDPAIEAVVLEVLARIPVPVAWYIVEHCVVVGVGVDSVAWQIARVPSGGRPQHLVALTTTRHEVIAHELGHAWQNYLPAPAPKGLTVAERKRLRSERKRAAEAMEKTFAVTAVKNDRVDAYVSLELEEELAADAAATAWGFPIASCGDGRRASIRAAITRLAKPAEGETR